MKGLRDLVRACAAMAGRREFELTVAGPGDPAFKTALAAEAGPTSPWLRILGELPRDDVRSAMEDADIFVLPSRSEGFPYVLLEAMSMGLAVVATRVGAIPGMLDGPRGAVGELVPPGDAAALESRDRAGDRRHGMARRTRLGGASLAVEREFTAEVVCGTYLNLWTGRPLTSGASA